MSEPTRYSAIRELTLWRVREFLREPEAVFWVFVFPVLLAFALGIAFKNRGPADIHVGVVNQGNDAVIVAAMLESDSSLAVELLDSAEAHNRLRTGRVTAVVVPSDPIVVRFDSTREESHLARLAVGNALNRVSGRSDVVEIREQRVTEPGSRYIDFLIPGLL